MLTQKFPMLEYIALFKKIHSHYSFQKSRKERIKEAAIAGLKEIKESIEFYYKKMKNKRKAGKDKYTIRLWLNKLVNKYIVHDYRIRVTGPMIK